MDFIDAIQANKTYNNAFHKTKLKPRYKSPKIKTAKNIFTNQQQCAQKELENYQETTIKNAIINNITSQHNIYQQIHVLFTINQQEWPELPYLNGKKKREIFIEKIKQEIKDVNRKNFNYKKHQAEIFTILGLSRKSKFNQHIVKNMYIAKLQNIIIIIQNLDAENDNDLKEVKSSGLCM